MQRRGRGGARVSGILWGVMGSWPSTQCEMESPWRALSRGGTWPDLDSSRTLRLHETREEKTRIFQANEHRMLCLDWGAGSGGGEEGQVTTPRTGGDEARGENMLLRSPLSTEKRFSQNPPSTSLAPHWSEVCQHHQSQAEGQDHTIGFHHRPRTFIICRGPCQKVLGISR